MDAPVLKTSDTSLPGALQSELVMLTARMAPADGTHHVPLLNLTCVRSSTPSPPLPSLYEPSLCFVVQGQKRALLQDELYVYDPLNYLVVSVILPMNGQITHATPEHPYLCLRLPLDIKLVGELLLQLGPAVVRKSANGRGLFVARTNARLLEALVRLLRLGDEPRDIAVLAPLVRREIHYRTLIGELGHRLQQLCMVDGQVQRIGGAIQMLKERYAEPLRIEHLAAAAHMSVSSLHHQFKAVTAMSPVQFQKHLRLQEARRLMLTEGLVAASAAHRVGYESASQFSREYRRLFGSPPRREIEAMRRSDWSAAPVLGASGHPAAELFDER